MKCCSGDKNQAKKIAGRLCYCFTYDEADFLQAIKSGTEQQLLDDIKAKMKDPGCFCERSNPSGKCCLADIQAFISQNK